MYSTSSKAIAFKAIPALCKRLIRTLAYAIKAIFGLPSRGYKREGLRLAYIGQMDDGRPFDLPLARCHFSQSS